MTFPQLHAQRSHQEKLDSLERALPLLIGKDKVNALLDLGEGYWYSNPKKAVELLQRGVGLAREQHKKILPSLYNSLGVAYNIRAVYDSAEIHFQNALALAEEQQNNNLIPTICTNLGIFYQYRQQYSKALQYLHKALESNGKHGNKHRTLGTMANVFLDIGDVRNALHYDSLAYNEAIQAGDEITAFALLHNLAIKLKEAEMKHEARQLFIKDISYHHTERPGSFRLANAYMGYGELLYTQFNNLDSGYYYTSLALDLYQDLNIPREVANASAQLAMIDFKQRKFTTAEKYARRAYHLLDSLDVRNYVLQNAAFIVMRISDMHNRHVEAGKWEDAFWELEKEVQSKKVANATIEMQTKYETEQKARENEMLKRKSALTDAELGRKNYALLSSILGIVLLIAIALTLTLRNKQKKRINALLQLENQSLRVANLNAQLNLLKDQINPHFLFNSLNTLKAMMQEEDKHCQAFIDNLSVVYRYILQTNMASLVSLREELSIAEAYIFMLKTRFEGNLQANFDIPEQVLERKIPPFSLQLLIENAVKHNIISRSRPLQIAISLKNSDELSIKNTLQPKRSIEDSTKVGLQNLQSRFQLLSQKFIQIENDGRSFNVTIPLV